MHTHSLADYMPHIRSGAWDRVAELMLSSARTVAEAGASFAICPDNTIHQAFDLVEAESPIPWLHIAHVVGEEAERRGYARLGILGTRYLMTGPIYPDVLRRLGIGVEIPEAADRDRIDEIIFAELVNGVFTEASRSYFNAVIAAFEERQCDAAVLGCTEIPLIVDPDDCPLPTLDSTRLLARAALARSLA
jgi:aspartate racemase